VLLGSAWNHNDRLQRRQRLLRFAVLLIRLGGIALRGPRSQRHRGAFGISAEAQPTQNLQVIEIRFQQPRLHKPGSSQIPEGHAYITAPAAAPLQVAVELSHPQHSTWPERSLPLVAQRLQCSVRLADGLIADAEKLHGVIRRTCP
jgi:hypothetical protein